MFREASYYSKLTLGVYRYSRMPLEKDPPTLVRRMIEHRESNFLDLMRRAVFANPANPYYTLFQWAGCTYEDLERAVRADGLEPTLDSLRKEGVYITNDEFKGKIPVERSGKRLVVESQDFGNPLVEGLFHITSGGSRSVGTSTWRSLEFQAYREAQMCVFYNQLGLAKRRIVGIRPILPSDSGMRMAINAARRGLNYDSWFALGGAFRDSAHYRTVLKVLLMEARLLGVPVKFPAYLPHNDFSPVARRVAQLRSDGEDCLLWCSASQGVRVAAAAIEEGLDISGTACILGAEAVTDAKREVVERAGCDVHTRYGVSEIGQVGVGCEQMKQGEVHVCQDSLAIISYRRMAPLTEVEIDSLMFTTLTPWTAFIFVNVEMDDSGKLEPVRCDCPLKAMGFTHQLSNIYSYGRLTGQGLTLMGSDMLRILEKSLPERFGGTNTDYQLVECEGVNQTEIELRVHPRVNAGSADEVKRFFLNEMKRLWGGSPARRVWGQTEGIRVVIAEPYLTLKQRVLPLHLLGTTKRQRSGEAAGESSPEQSSQEQPGGQESRA